MSHTTVGMNKRDRRGFQPRNKVVKFAISLPREEADYVERVRKSMRATRSAVVRDAIRQKLKAERNAEWNRQCEEGYRLIPETEDERMVREALLKIAAEHHEKEEW